jgi:hypothetical protein
MKMTQAWGWLAAGVLAAALNASYHDGGMRWAHQIADSVQHNSVAVLALASGRADQFLTEARLITPQAEAATCPFARSLARIERRIENPEARFEEAEVQSFDLMSAREEARMARVEAIRARVQARVEANTMRLRMAPLAFTSVSLKGMPAADICPRIRVQIPRVPMMKMPVTPRVHVEIPGAGPV